MNTNMLMLVASLIIVGLPVLFIFIKERGKKVSAEEWAIADRSLPIYVIIGTQFATCVGGATLVADIGIAYDMGLSSVTYVFVATAPLLVLMLLAPWIRENNFATIPDMLEHFYGKSKTLSSLGSFFALIVPFGWLTGQIAAFGLIYGTITGIPKHVLMVGFCIVSLFYVLPSGLKTVAWTDFIFACFILVGCVLIMGYGFDMAGGIQAVLNSPNIPVINNKFPSGFFAVGVPTILLWLTSALPGGMTNQLYFQRISAIKDAKKVNSSLMLSVIPIMFAGVFSYLLGMTIRHLQPALANPEGASAWFLTQVPEWLMVTFGGLICAMILSTASSATQSAVANITLDIYKRNINPDASDEQIVKLSRISTVLLLAVAGTLSILFPHVLKLLVYTYAFSAAGLFGPIYVGYFTRKTRPFNVKTIIASMVVACVVVVIVKLNGSFGTPIPFSVFGLSASVMTMFIGKMISGKKDDEENRERAA